MLGHSARGTAFAFALGALLTTSAADAGNFTVASGQTYTSTQTLWTPGDTGTIEKGGTIDVTGAFTFGVISSGIDNTANNYGTVRTNGDNSDGIYGNNDNFVANNWGSITGSGSTTTGIFANSGLNAVLNNFGTIYQTGWGTEGIFSYGDYATIVNSGTITTLDDVTETTDATAGIYTSGYQPNVLNTGSIATTGYTSIGIFSWSDDATITNKGTIKATGDAAYGIYSFDAANVTIVNRGSIVASGIDYSEGVLHYVGDNATLINSGRIIATASAGDAYAIDMYGANDTVTLLAHSAIEGGIYFEQPGTATLNIGTGLNTALTLYDYLDLPSTLDTAGQPYVFNGAVLAVVDPTGLAAANSFAFDLSRSIADTVEARMATPDNAGLTTGALPGQTAAGRGYWAAGLGFFGDHAADGSLDGYDYGAAGLTFGADRSLSAANTAGLFGGFSAGGIATAAQSTTVNANGAFAGGYWSHDDGKAFTHVSITGGGLDNASDRTVANNLVSGGLETASAHYGSFYVSPALTLGLHEPIPGATLSPSLGVRYTGLYRGGYTESGSAPDVTASSSTAQALDLRGELRSDFATKVSNAGVGRLNVRAGVDGIFSWGGATDGQLLGTDIELLAGGQQSVARGYLGAGMTFTGSGGSILNGGVTASYDTADTFAVSAQAGMNHAF